MVRRVIIMFLFSIFFVQQTLSAEKVWQASNSGLNDVDVRSISVFPKDDNFVSAACLKHIYFSEDGGNFWRELFSLEAEGEELNFVTFDSSDPKILYVATTKGLFSTKNQGKTWRRVFRKVSVEAEDISWIALDSFDYRKIYIGTGEGLYVSYDLGETWRKADGGLPYSQVKSIAVHPSNSCVLYLANTYGLFKSIDSAQSWERIYVTSLKVADEEKEEPSEISENQNLINCIAIDKHNPKRIFIATGSGVFVSRDSGESWNKLPVQGLSSDYVNFILVSLGRKDAVYAATKKGVFEFLPNLNRWGEIYQGLTARDIRSLALNMQGKQLFAGTDRGVFKTVEIKNVQNQNKQEKVDRNRNEGIDFEGLLKELSQSEPTIRQVQEAALKYAEVIHPKRIKTLRRNARLKALLPDVSVDYDKTVYGSASSGNVITGPYDWGLSLSWDVGDLVFNEQVRLIDSNTRLMVQLRDNILNEVTRLYYERRKLQTEFILTPPETAKDKLTRRLRLEELTANIDALTGGYFSHYLEIPQQN